eukprot:354925-Chlamydomonas_euryale.AAC.2
MTGAPSLELCAAHFRCGRVGSVDAVMMCTWWPQACCCSLQPPGGAAVDGSALRTRVWARGCGRV